MEIENTTPELTQRRRNQFRLKILLIVTGLLLAAVFFSQLSPSVVKKLGPAAETVYDLFNAPTTEPLSLSGQRVVADVDAVWRSRGRRRADAGAFRSSRPQGVVLDRFHTSSPAARMSSSAIVSSALLCQEPWGSNLGNLPDRHRQ